MNTKKIGILTFFNRMNYGADLQAYALCKKVNDLGFQCDILDVLSPKDPLAKPVKLYKPIKTLSYEISIKQRINIELMKYLSLIIGLNNKKNRNSKFADFKQNYLKTSKSMFASVDELYSCVDSYDIFIVGSDQVWNPQATISSPEPYFLTFANGSKKKISYAASFGVSALPIDLHNQYNKWLSSIDHISVRENMGAEIVRDLIGYEPQVVLDPTMLLTRGEWNDIASNSKVGKPYILVYSRIYSPYMARLARYISEITGFIILRIPRGDFREGVDYKIKNLFGIGPLEFVGLFKNAEFIITSSFHGTAFSINYNKPFYSVVRTNDLVKGRITSLLKNFGLSYRLLSENDFFPDKSSIELEFSSSNLILEKKRDESIAFIRNAIVN